MKTIRCTDTLFYYDGPQILEALDAIGGHYLVVMVNVGDDRDRCLAVGVAPDRIRQFRAGALDLKSLMVEAGSEEWHLATATNLEQPLAIELQQTPLSESGLLPDDGFFLPHHQAEELTLKEARKRNNLILEISVAPPESVCGHGIRLDTYAKLLTQFQTIARHAWRAASKGDRHHLRTEMKGADEHLMNVVIPAATGSFRVVLEAAGGPGALGTGALACALQRMDLVFEHASSPHDTLVALREHRGHLASAYLKFLRFLVQRKTGFRYSWAEPTSTAPTCREILESEARPLVEALSASSNRYNEVVTYVGEFEKFNRKTGAWGLLTRKGTVSGLIREGGPDLDRLVVGERYKFYCVMETEEVESTGRKSHTLYLKQHAPA